MKAALIFTSALLIIILGCQQNDNKGATEKLKDQYDSLVQQYVYLRTLEEGNYLPMDLIILKGFVQNDSIAMEMLEDDLIKMKASQRFMEAFWQSANEPDLSQFLNLSFTDSIEIYRMSYVHGYEGDKHHIIKLVHQDSSIVLHKKTVLFDKECATPLVGFHNAKPFGPKCFTLLEDNQRLVDMEGWAKFKSLIKDFDFYHLPTDDIRMPFNDKMHRMCSGEHIRVEGFYHHNIHSRYHSIYRSCPDATSAVMMISDYLWDLSEQ